MRLNAIIATPSLLGNRIDLSWTNPDAVAYPGVRIVRRGDAFPEHENDGVIVAEGTGHATTFEDDDTTVYHASDTGLDGERVYYYGLFPHTDDAEPQYARDERNRAAALATAPYDFARRMYDLLPALYRRYDAALVAGNPGSLAPEDAEHGPLLRFLDVVGGFLDQVHSHTRFARELHNLDRVDGRLLPLLAQWIGWPTDYRRGIDGQRTELRQAPHIYRTIGIIPIVEATIKRILGWESRTKEFAHNVVRSNSPERLNIWLIQRGTDDAWSQPTAPLSLNYAYEGRPSAATDEDGVLWIVYHTRRKRVRETWFDEDGFRDGPGPGASVRFGQWDVWSKTYDEAGGWSESRPLTQGNRLDRQPTIAAQGETLWMIWASYSEDDKKWRLDYRTRSGGEWTARAVLVEDDTERRRPWAVADEAGGLWLFWMEKVGRRWQLRYNRHDGATWTLAAGTAFPDDGGSDPRVEGDPFVLFHPGRPARPLWVFWARKDTMVPPDQRRTQIAYRVKQSLDPSLGDWGAVETLARPDPEDADYDPAAVVNADGNIELFFASSRDRSPSIWHAVLDLDTDTWGEAVQITGNPFTQRAPLAVPTDDGTMLLFRSNESVEYQSEDYTATVTVDHRYAGSTSVDERNVAKTALRGTYFDFQTYTFDTGTWNEAGTEKTRTDLDWYAHDTVGLYLTPDTEDATNYNRSRKVIEDVLKQFLPITVRAVLAIELISRDHFYPDGFPPENETTFFTLDVRPAPEVYAGLVDDYTDTVPGWTFIRAWSTENTNHASVDFDEDPIDTSLRTWHTGLEEGG